MKLKLSITFTLSLLLLFGVQAQDSKWSIGFQAGRTQLYGETQISYEQLSNLEAQGMGGINIQLYGRYNFYKRASVFATGGINHLVSGMRFNGKRGKNFQTSGETAQYFIGLDYDIPFGGSGFGLISKLAYGITGSNARDKDGNRFQWQGDSPLERSTIGIGDSHILDPLTGAIEDRRVFLREFELLASKDKFIRHIRPELSLYKKYDRHQFSLSAVFALATNPSFYTEKHLHLKFKGNRNTARHHFGGHYTALLFGYEFRF